MDIDAGTPRLKMEVFFAPGQSWSSGLQCGGPILLSKHSTGQPHCDAQSGDCHREARNATTATAKLLTRRSSAVQTKQAMEEGSKDSDEEMMNLLLQELMESSEEEDEVGVWGGSKEGRAANKARDFAGACSQLVKDCFSGSESVHSEKDFERRFRMPRSLFSRIHDALMGEDPFVQKRDTFGKLGIHPLVKMVACFRHLACGDACDREDENLWIAQSTLIGFVRQFSKLMIREFGPEHLTGCQLLLKKAMWRQLWKEEDFPAVSLLGIASTSHGRIAL